MYENYFKYEQTKKKLLVLIILLSIKTYKKKRQASVKNYKIYKL